MMQERNPDGDGWVAKARGLGWQKHEGRKQFQARTGAGLLRAILPRTQCTYSIYALEEEVEKGAKTPFLTMKRRGRRIIRGFKIVNSHHDAMGEVYEILPVKLGCVDCHGGNANAATKEEAHVQPCQPQAWPTSANPVRSYMLFLTSSTSRGWHDPQLM